MATSLSTEAASKDRKRNGSARQIVDATAALLSERSAMDVSLSDIAKKSGLNSAMIRYYFGNKDGLLLAVLEAEAVTAMAALDHLVGMQIPADKKIRIHINGIINAYYRSPFLNRLIHYMIEYGENASSQRVNQIYVEPMLKAYTKIVEQGVEEGIFDDFDPTFLYFSIVGACDHIFHGTYSIPTALGLSKVTEELKQRYVNHVSRLVLNGMVKR